MTRVELDQAITRLVDAERFAAKVKDDDSRTGAIIVAAREAKDARADLDGLLDLLDHELAFAP